MNRLLKNFSYTFIANIINFLISAAVAFFVPKALGTESYGYFQLYLFYTSYIGFFHFGWADGIYLRYGGAYYDQLDKARMSAQFRLYTAFVVILGAIICLFGVMTVSPADRAFVVGGTGLAILLMLPRTFLLYVLQCTNRIREYALGTVTERIVYFLVVIIVLISGTSSFRPLLFGDLAGKLTALILTVWICRDLVKSKPEPLAEAFPETRRNVTVGIRLMFSNIASMLIVGIVRLAIERHWDVETFGKVSLTMAISNLFMVFIESVALILFPALRRTDPDRLTELYSRMRSCLMLPLFGILILYYPAYVILSAWLPAYADKLRYMAILFPMCVYESKTSMLVNTYLKTLRKEKTLMTVNLVTVALSAALSGVFVFGMNSLDFAIVSIVVLLAFRCIAGEVLLAKEIRIRVVWDILQELLLTAGFILASWLIGGIRGVLIYAVLYAAYLMLHRADLSGIAALVRSRIHS